MKYVLVFLSLLYMLGVFAQSDALRSEVMQHPKVHEGKCQWRGYYAPCEIFYREADDSIFLVLNNGKRVTYIVHITNQRVETILYANPQYST